MGLPAVIGAGSLVTKSHTRLILLENKSPHRLYRVNADSIKEIN
jgi:hypothetical protein